MPTIDLLDHLHILNVTNDAIPARHPGWRARRLTPPGAGSAVWVQWDPAVAVVALLVDDDASPRGRSARRRLPADRSLPERNHLGPTGPSSGV